MVILLATLSLAVASGAENSLKTVDELANVVRSSFEKQDGGALLRHYYAEGKTSSATSMTTNAIASRWGKGSWKVSKVEVHPYDKYRPTTGAPGELNGKQLHWLAKPSHWIVLQTEMTLANGRSVPRKFEMAAFQHDDRWLLMGVTDRE